MLALGALSIQACQDAMSLFEAGSTAAPNEVIMALLI